MDVIRALRRVQGYAEVEGADGEKNDRTAFRLACLSSKIVRLACGIAIGLSALLLLIHFDVLSNPLPVHSIAPHTKPHTEPSGLEPVDESVINSLDPDFDWSRFAYVQYVTNRAYLCNSVMMFERLHTLESRPDRLMMYPHQWAIGADIQTPESKLLLKAQDEYGVILQPIEVQQASDDFTWGASFTKLLAFNQTAYERVLSLDSDATILQAIDELFLIPSAPVAMPRAYWLNPADHVLSSQLLLVEPSDFEFKRIMEAIKKKKDTDFDMEIVNNLYGDSCVILGHRKYDLLTGEFRKNPNDHVAYLGNDQEKWDGDKIIKEAKFVHFSDWPYPKPWVKTTDQATSSTQPPCVTADDSEDCRDRRIWTSLYNDFRERRERVCGNPYFRLVKRDRMETRKPSRYEFIL